jgi:hypothetical protein
MVQEHGARNQQMRYLRSRGLATGAALFLGLGAGLLGNRVAGAATDSFAALMSAAMDRMDRDMMVPPSGDPDRDFAAMMIPHHQGAIDMATIELRYGRDPILRRLAQGIVVEQQQEIVVMRQALAALPPLPTRSNAAMTPAMKTMPSITHPKGNP